jgi:aminomethyltransferase
MSTGFDMAGVQRGARLQRSPYFAATQRHGCRGYTVYNHTFLPIAYDDLEAEYWKLLNDVTVWDVGVEKNTEIVGPDALAFANMLTPRDLTKCRVGQAKYVVITATDGGIVNDPVLLRLEENRFWLAAADSDLHLWAMGLAHGAGLRVEIRRPEVYPLQIQGPKSKPVVEKLFGTPVLELPYYHFLETRIDGIPVVVTRTGWSGEVGYEVYLCDPARGLDLWDRVMEAGRPHGIAPTGPSDIRRIEAGILNYGIDMTLDDNPFHVGLEWMVRVDREEGFVGQQALRRVKSEGVTRRLVGIEIEGQPLDLNMTAWPVHAAGEPIGRVTSAVWSPRLRKNIGYAMLPVASGALGTRLEVQTPDGERGAVVVARPFVDPDKDVPKS